jgi:hypothetical protein
MRSRLCLVVLTVFAILMVADVALAEIGQIKTLDGEVYILRDNNRIPATLGALLKQADIVETGPSGSVGITFIDSSRFSAGPDTRLELSRFRFNPTTQDGEFLAGLDRGTLTVISGQIAKRSHEAMKIKTPTTILGFRGTRVAVKVTD